MFCVCALIACVCSSAPSDSSLTSLRPLAARPCRPPPFDRRCARSTRRRAGRSRQGSGSSTRRRWRPPRPNGPARWVYGGKFSPILHASTCIPSSPITHTRTHFPCRPYHALTPPTARTPARSTRWPPRTSASSKSPRKICAATWPSRCVGQPGYDPSALSRHANPHFIVPLAEQVHRPAWIRGRAAASRTHAATCPVAPI